MLNKLKTFKSDIFGNIRVLEINNIKYFVAGDITKALRYTNTSKALKDHCGYVIKKSIQHPQNGTKSIDVNFIENDDLCSLITRSRNTTSNYREEFFLWLQSEYLLDNKIVCATRKEIEFVEVLEKTLEPFGYTIIKQFNVLGYKLDAYIEDLNLAIEYDENGHKDYTYEQHEGRQKEVERELGCNFIRVGDNNNHNYNVGLVLKEIFNMGMVA